MAGHPDNEIIVVDNASTDGSRDLLRERFPRVRVVALDRNHGFGGGSNAGFRTAKNRIVVLLNSDMRVAQDFLAPLLEGFTGDSVFAVSCQIFFSDPNKLREETGLTQGWWEDGALRVRHRNDAQVLDLFPCFYGGGGSCAFDREKFLELGGFDPLLAPFYLEDTDLGYMAWKRGWKVLYQPNSRVWHEHRGTIGKRFTEAQIQAVLKKNFILFCWKNIHEWPRLGSHFFFAWAGALLAVIFGDVHGRANFRGIWRAFLQLPGALRSRWRARSLAAVSDTEAFRRPLGGYFRDRFESIDPERQPLRVLFVSPYPICPPVHGGGVFMYQTLRELAKLCETHVVELLDHAWQSTANEELREFCASAEWLVRMESRSRSAGSILPHAVTEFASDDLEWLIHRQIYTRKIDVVQLEYTPLGQYTCDYRRIPNILFEHDVYFQSIARGLGARAQPSGSRQGALRISPRAALRAAHAGRAATGSRCARGRTGNTWSRTCRSSRRDSRRGCARASTHRGTSSGNAAGNPTRCCSSAVSGTIRIAWRSTGSCTTCCRWWRRGGRNRSWWWWGPIRRRRTRMRICRAGSSCGALSRKSGGRSPSARFSCARS